MCAVIAFERARPLALYLMMNLDNVSFHLIMGAFTFANARCLQLYVGTPAEAPTISWERQLIMPTCIASRANYSHDIAVPLTI